MPHFTCFYINHFLFEKSIKCCTMITKRNFKYLSHSYIINNITIIYNCIKIIIIEKK